MEDHKMQITFNRVDRFSTISYEILKNEVVVGYLYRATHVRFVCWAVQLNGEPFDGARGFKKQKDAQSWVEANI
jgi:hypothetical protein